MPEILTPVYVPSGTAALPGLAFNNDHSTGLFRSSVGDTLAFAYAGVEIARTSVGAFLVFGQFISKGAGAGSGGSAAAPAFSISPTNGAGNVGMYSPANDTLCFSTSDVERIKITSAEITINETGVNQDFRVEGDTEPNLLLIDAGTDRVGIGVVPAARLDVLQSSLVGTAMVKMTGTVSTPVAVQNDSVLTCAAAVSANSATNHGTLRAMLMQATNGLTGGGQVGTLVCYNAVVNTSAGTTTGTLAHLFLESGTAAGTVTNGFGIYIVGLQGTTKYGVYDASGSIWWNTGGGLVCGTPTGGYKGAGTINASAVYDDNVLLTDHIFDQWLDGAIQPVAFETRRRPSRKPPPPERPGQEPRAPIDEEYQVWPGSDVEVSEQDKAQRARLARDGVELLTIDQTETFVRTQRHLPSIRGRQQWKVDGRPSTGEIITMLWETVERLQLHIFELNARLKALEG